MWGIKLIKKINESLFAKVFTAALLFLIFAGLSVFGILAFVMPKTYSSELNMALDIKTKNFISELEKISFNESANLFDRFIYTDDILSAELYSENGSLLSIPTVKNTDISQTVENFDEPAPVISGTYYFSFLNSDKKYTLVIYGNAAELSILKQSFIRVFPVILIIIIIISFSASWIFSKIVTLPVLKISNIALKMSDMELDWELDENRSDELGILKKSLNNLSKKLCAALNDLKKANSDLKVEILRVNALKQAQTDFFSAASHELKTPVTVIKGQLEGMLFKIGAYKDRDTYLARSLKTVDTLENMIQELLTVSRLQISDFDLKSENFEPAPLIKKYLSEIEDLIIDKDLHINQNFTVPAIINGNKFLIEKVFSNLIGNAVKYSPRKAVIDISIRKSLNGYIFIIKNSGTFIPEEAVPKIFDAFYRVDASRARETGGSGLGLYITQEILHHHNSLCKVRNIENGVEFSFELLQPVITV